MPLSEETVGGFSLPPTINLTVKEATMGKVNLIVQECLTGKRKPEDVNAAVFLSNAAALTKHAEPSIIKDTDQSQDSLCSGKGADYGASES